MPSLAVGSIWPVSLTLKWVLLLVFVLSEVLVTRISLAGTSEFVIFPVQPPSLHSHHPSYSRTQHPLLPSPLLVSLLQFTLHGCLVPNACRLLWVFLARNNFSSPFIWDVCSPSTICFIFLCPLFSQRSIPSVPGDGFFKCLFYSVSLWFSLNHKVIWWERRTMPLKLQEQLSQTEDCVSSSAPKTTQLGQERGSSLPGNIFTHSGVTCP